ncbi:MAG: murein L,D-transpeptidase [Bauldia sp.]|nr:murein L,D-transpeptidase [Bauldia sp.]
MAFRSLSAFIRFGAIGLAALTLTACQESSIPKDLRPVSYKLTDKMRALAMKETSPVLIRIFKEESALEVWKQRRDGTYALLKTYTICKWSGVLGPKVKEGDRQAPEGFYVVTPAQMNPKSSYYLSFNIGYPNSFDRALGRTGTHLMVHGACSSAGCYSMTDADAGELFALARDAFRGGQTSFQIQAFPFRMTPENLARHRDDPNMAFWRMLKVGYDHFEVTRLVPKIDVCEKRYVFNADTDSARFVAAGRCPAYTVPETIAVAVAAKQAADDQKFAAAVVKQEADAAALAEQKLKAQEAVAAKAAADAEAAARPPLLSRWFGRGTKKPAEPSAAAEPVITGTTATPISAVAPAPRAKPSAKPIVEANAVPAPVKPKPKSSTTTTAAKAAPAPATSSPPAAAEDAPPEATTAGDSVMEPIPGAVDGDQPAATDGAATGGKLVKRDFYWADAPTMAGGTEILKPSLSSSAN